MKAIEENEKNQRCKNRRLSNDRDYKYKKLTLKEIDEAIDLGENLEEIYAYQKLTPENINYIINRWKKS